MSKKALLINPPVYDVQYWAEWSQPHGLLKIGSFLKARGYETRLIDCLFPDSKRRVPKKTKAVVEYCSTTQIPYSEYHKQHARLGPNQRLKFVFGTNLDDLRRELLVLNGMVELGSSDNGAGWAATLFPEDSFVPDEIWITSIMTYWWESTVDVAVLAKKIFPAARLRIGGIYPTLCPEHLQQKLKSEGLTFGIELGCDLSLEDQRDLVVVGEIPKASWLDLDLDLYFEPWNPRCRYYHGPAASQSGYETAINDRRHYGPSYAILTTTRGCPFNCAYCAQHAYNLYDEPRVREELWTDPGGRKCSVREREAKDTIREVRDKFERYGIREFAFYEDNFLVRRKHFKDVLRGITSDPTLRGNIHLHAPEGVEVRLIDSQLAKLMREAGFERIYLPLENINTEVMRSWNRSHSNVHMFEQAVENCKAAGFTLRNMQVNAFLLFGTPGEKMSDVVDSAFYASSRIGSVIPMLFTPVPRSALYEEHREYLSDEMRFDLQHLNGKLLPFLELNRRLHPGLQARDYLELEALMFRLNAQAVRGTFDIGADTRVARAFRDVVVGTEPR